MMRLKKFDLCAALAVAVVSVTAALSEPSPDPVKEMIDAFKSVADARPHVTLNELLSDVQADPDHPIGVVARRIAHQPDIIDRLLTEENPVLRIGYRPSTPPFSDGPDYKARRNESFGRSEVSGFAINLCDRVFVAIREAVNTYKSETNGEVGDFRRRYYPVTRANLKSDLETGRVDIICGPITITRERMSDMLFSIPFYVTGSVGIAKLNRFSERADRNFMLEPSRLENEKIGVFEDTSSAERIESLITDEKIEPFPSIKEAVTALMNDEVSMVVGDREILLQYVRDNRAQHAVRLDQLARSQEITYEPYAIPLGRGEERLKCIVDIALSEIFSLHRNAPTEGFIIDAYEKHIAKHSGELRRNRLPSILDSLYFVNALPTTGAKENPEAACIGSP